MRISRNCFGKWRTFFSVLRHSRPGPSSFGGDDPGNASQVVSYTDACPVWQVEKWPHGRKTVVAEFENQETTANQATYSLSDQVGVEFVAFFAAIQGEFGFVVANFTHECFFFFVADVGRVTDDEVVFAGGLCQKTELPEHHAILDGVAGGVAPSDD